MSSTRRVRIDRLRPAVGNLPPLLARTVDVDAVVEQWRALRSAADSPTHDSTTAGAPGGNRAGGDAGAGEPAEDRAPSR